MKKCISVLLAMMLAFGLTACGSESEEASGGAGNTYTVGICNYVDDASLNQIVANIVSQLQTLG